MPSAMRLMQNSSQIDVISHEMIRFKALAAAYQKYAEMAGVQLIAYRDEGLPLFTAQSGDERRKVLEALEVCVEICQEHQNQGHAMNDSPVLIWNSLRRFGFRPPSDLFSHITRDRVIEIYSTQGIQIFRSFNFYKFCSYSLEELYCNPWYLLYQRDEATTLRLMDALVQFFSGKWAEIVQVDIPPHSVKELLSPDQNEIMVSVSHISPLFGINDSLAQAVLAIESAELVSSKSNSFTRPVSAPSNLDTIELR
jgi:hypothetical protein